MSKVSKFSFGDYEELQQEFLYDCQEFNKKSCDPVWVIRKEYQLYDNVFYGVIVDYDFFENNDMELFEKNEYFDITNVGDMKHELKSFLLKNQLGVADEFVIENYEKFFYKK